MIRSSGFVNEIRYSSIMFIARAYGIDGYHWVRQAGGAACDNAEGVGWTGSFQPALPQSPVPHSCEYGNSISLRDTDFLEKKVVIIIKKSWHPCPHLDFLKQQKEGDSVFTTSLLTNIRRKYFKAFHCDIWMLSLKQKPCISGRSCWVRLQSPEGQTEHLWRFPWP